MKSRPDLVFGASTGLVCGDGFVGSKYRRARYVSAVSKGVCDRFHFRFAKAFARHLHLAVGIDQEKSRDTGQVVGIRNLKTGLVNQNRERDAKLPCEIARRTGVVLRNAKETHVPAAILFEDPFEKGEGELADRTGNFEEREHNRAALQGRTKREFLAANRFQQKTGCSLPRNGF